MQSRLTALTTNYHNLPQIETKKPTAVHIFFPIKKYVAAFAIISKKPPNPPQKRSAQARLKII